MAYAEGLFIEGLHALGVLVYDFPWFSRTQPLCLILRTITRKKSIRRAQCEPSIKEPIEIAR